MCFQEDKDVEFNINCTGDAMINMTVKSGGIFIKHALDQSFLHSRFWWRTDIS